ncbi:MAG: glycosyl transferase family 90 [Pseudomonadota bacterium]
MFDRKFSRLAGPQAPSASAPAAALTSDPLIEKRLKIYLGPLTQLTHGEYIITYPWQTMLCHAKMTFDDIENAYREANGQPVANIRTLRNYAVPLVELHRKFSIDAPFMLVAGDPRQALSVPAFAKARPLLHPGNSVLLPLNAERHWMPIEDVIGHDIEFRHKRPTVVWRGTTTGIFKRKRGRETLGSRAHVPRVLQEIDADWLDMGYSSVGRLDAQSEFPREHLRRCIKNKLSIPEQLQSKFILCLEGNDVSTSLKWVLYSNSAVIMPHPTVESWACESLLIPFHHYIPVRTDLSDLADVFKWCEDNDDKCADIARNGSNFIKRFLYRRTEMRIIRRVIMEYHRRVRLIETDPHPDCLSNP